MTQTLIQLFPMIILFAVFYFLLIRPQQQKQKKHQEMISNLKKGDKVTTIGGLYGTITGFKGDNTLILKIAPSTDVEFLRTAISHVRVESKEKIAKEEIKEIKEEAESKE